MADESKKPVNSIPKPIEEAIADRNRRIDHSYLDNDDKYSSMVNGHSQVQDTIASLTKKLKGTRDPNQASKLASEIQESANLQQQFENRIDQYQLSNANQQNHSLADRIKTYTNTRNVNQRTTTMAGEQRFMRMAHESPELYAPTEVLEQRVAQKSKELGNVGRELSTRIRGIGDGDIPSNLLDKAAKVQELQEDIALNKRMLKVQSKEGLSTEKRMYAAEGTIEAAGGYLKQDMLRKDVAAGKYGDIQSETSKLAEMFQALTSATERWKEATENATDAQGNLTKEYKEASAELEKIQKETEQQRKVVGEVQRQGGGGGGMNGSSLRQYAQFGSQMVAAGYGIDIDDKITEMNLKSRTGQTAVDQFNRVGAAAGGDMRSLLRESTSQEFIKNFSDSMRSKAIRQGAANTAMTGLDAVGTGITALGDLDATGATLGVGAGIMNTLRTGSQVFRGLPQTVKALEAYAAGESFSGVGLEIPAQGLQAVYDQQMAAYSGTIGLGSQAGAAAEATLMDRYTLTNFAQQGMTPAQAASLTSMSAGALGANEAATTVALNSAKIERTGMMSASQYIGMAGQLAEAGGGTKDLEEIMRNAVASGMDNAKNIQQMVSATVSLSGSMAKMGMSGAGASSTLLASTIQNIGGDKNIAALAAESMINKRAAMDSSSDVNLGNVFEHAELRKIDPQMSTPELMAMAKLTQQEYRQIIEGGPEAAYEFGLEKVWERAGGVEAFKKGAGVAGQATAINMGLGTFGGGEDIEAIGRGDTRNLTTASRALAFTSGTSYKAFGVNAAKEAEEESYVMRRSSAQGMMEADAAKKVQTFSFGAGDDVNKTLQQLVVTMQALVTNLTPEKAQQNVEGKMENMTVAGPIAKAGTDFKTAAGAFTEGVKEFNKLLKNADQGEHRVKFNYQDNSGGSTRKTNGTR